MEENPYDLTEAVALRNLATLLTHVAIIRRNRYDRAIFTLRSFYLDFEPTTVVLKKSSKVQSKVFHPFGSSSSAF